MGLTRKVPAEQAELSQQESGEPEGPNRFASAKFTVRLQPKEATADSEDRQEQPDDSPDQLADTQAPPED